MSITFEWSRLASMSALQFHRIVEAREAVFVVEQACAYQEVDALDVAAWHLSVCVDGALAAYARVVAPGLKYAEPSIGRVMTLKPYRQHGLGRTLMDEAIRFTHATYPGLDIQIGGQVYLKGFYESLGFNAVGAPYDEDGILHIDMIKSV